MLKQWWLACFCDDCKDAGGSTSRRGGNASAAAELDDLCSLHGWSSEYSQDDAARWIVTIQIGPERSYCFISEDCSPASSKKGVRTGQAAAASTALAGLREDEDVQRRLSMPTMKLTDFFDSRFRGRILGSTPAGWAALLASSDLHAVGIDCMIAEGSGVDGAPIELPVVVQIAARDVIIVELPHAQGRLSSELEALLFHNVSSAPHSNPLPRRDALLADMRVSSFSCARLRTLGTRARQVSVSKIFCECSAARTRRSLGLPAAGADGATNAQYNLVDIETFGQQLAGRTRRARGLSKLVTLAMPEVSARETSESAPCEAAADSASVVMTA